MRDPILDLLISKGTIVGDCWIWIGALDTKGYGRVWLEGRGQSVHRVAFERSKGRIKPDFKVDHLCRNHACFNPQHLEQVSNQINVLRGFDHPIK